MKTHLLAFLISISILVLSLQYTPNPVTEGLYVSDILARPVLAQADSAIDADPLAFSCSNVTEILSTECEALVALYNITSGPTWSNHTNWLITATPCSWYGIACVQGHVVILELSNNQLAGSIPSQLGNLSQLVQIDLNFNKLSGAIPVELGNLINLDILYLIGNQLSGSIPSALGNLTNLTTLALDNNLINGNIPPEIGNLTKLIGFGVSGNQMTGSIPSELSNLINLQSLSLNNNQFSGALPMGFVNLTKLTSFSFNNTSLCEPANAEFQNWLIHIPTLNRTNILCTLADFDARPVSGNAPLNVTFNNLSIGNLLNCSWNYGDGITEDTCFRSHNHIFNVAGTYTVQLTVIGTEGTSTKTKTDYIRVNLAQTPTLTPTPTTTQPATNTPTSLATTPPPTTTSVPPTNTPTPTGSGVWVKEFLGAPADSVSLALDSTGSPHISFQYESLHPKDNLQYARRSGGKWDIEIVDPSSEAGFRGTSIALDKADNPHIIYHSGGQDIRPEHLKYAYRTASGWQIETIDSDAFSFSLALDAAGNPHISYGLWVKNIAKGKYAYRTANGWITEETDFFGSLVLDSSDNPHISYRSSEGPKYAYRTANGWVTEKIDNVDSDEISLALDKNDNPYIGYRSSEFGANWFKELRYAYRTASGWNIQVVDTVSNKDDWIYNVSLAVDTLGNPHISYSNRCWVTNHAYRTTGGWVSEIVGDTALCPGVKPGIALDAAGNPHISYGSPALIYAYKKGKGINSITGRVTDANNNPIAGVTLNATGVTNPSTATDSNGNFALQELAAGDYKITPSKTDYTFSPPSRTVGVPPDKSDANFTANPTKYTVPDLALGNFTIPTAPSSNPVVWQEYRLNLTIFNNGTTPFIPRNSDYSIILTTKDAQGNQKSRFVYSSDKFSTMEKLPSQLGPNATFTPRLPSIFFLEPISGGSVEVSLELRDKDPNLKNNVMTKHPFTIEPHPDTPQNCLSSILNAVFILFPVEGMADVIVKATEFFTIDLLACKDDFSCEITELTRLIAELIPVLDIVSSLEKLITQPPATCTSVLDYIYMILTEYIQQGISLNMISIESPAYALVTNSEGQHVGFLDDGTIIQEIPGSKVIDSHGKKVVIYPGNSTQTIRIKATGSGVMRLRLTLAGEDRSATHLDYQEVTLVSDTVGLLDIHNGTYALDLDDNGDGNIDRRKLPDELVISKTEYLYFPIVVSD